LLTALNIYDEKTTYQYRTNGTPCALPYE